ncbi:MAG TPA: hypothetical protein PLJ21_11920 [Pseudobdellovibrionaceae bacterium]|nr:hypothetical protein [Pseudobdellovibrionaceae bacterium]
MKKTKATKVKINRKLLLKKSLPHTDNLPATIGMLKLTEKKIISKMSSEFKKVNAKFSQMDAKFSQMDAKFSQMDAKFSQMDAKFDLMMAEIHRVAISVDEQNHRNKIVLDSHELLYTKISNFEAESNQRFKIIEEVQGKILLLKEKSPR